MRRSFSASETNTREAIPDQRIPRRSFLERAIGMGLSAAGTSMMLTTRAGAQPQPAFVYSGTGRGGGGPLKLLLWQGPTLLNPHFASGAKDQEGSRPFYESLAHYDVEGNLVPVLAAEIPSRQNGGIAADGRSTTWRLKSGVTWHDGAPFGADDVVFNWQYATDPANAAVALGAYAGIQVVEKLDPLTVRFTFAKPTPLWYRSAGLQLIATHLNSAYLGARAREAPTNLKPVGTGPYRFVDFKPGDLVRGEANPSYHMPNRPFFDTIEIKGGRRDLGCARGVADGRVRLRLERAGRGSGVVRPDVAALARTIVRPLAGWDIGLAALHDWY